MTSIAVTVTKPMFTDTLALVASALEVASSVSGPPTTVTFEPLATSASVVCDTIDERVLVGERDDADRDRAGIGVGLGAGGVR